MHIEIRYKNGGVDISSAHDSRICHITYKSFFTFYHPVHISMVERTCFTYQYKRRVMAQK